MFKRLCIIPARGGSKRIPGKNTRSFLGKPILHYSIEAAKSSGLFDVIMVSTDDEKVAEEALKSGASVPFFRSAETSGDHATTAEVLHEVLAAYAKQNIHFQQICCLYPTAVFTRPQHLVAGWALLLQDADVVYPIVGFDYPIWRAVEKREDNGVQMIWPGHANTRSQDLPQAYHDAGQWYWLNANAFITSGAILSGKAKGLEISRLEAQDIDDMEDWALAELKYQHWVSHPFDLPLAASMTNAIGFIPVNEEHSKLLLDWRNDPLTRAQSVNTQPVEPEEHWNWLKNKLKDPQYLMCMAQTEEGYVGVVRAEKDKDGYWWLSWTIAPEFRGKGWGKHMVKKWVHHLQHLPVKALIKHGNLSSEKIALEAGLTLMNVEEEFTIFSKIPQEIKVN